MKSKHFLTCLVLGSLFIGYSTCIGEEGTLEDSRGRLTDGRAFRTDSEGNQLVDYIAELELNVEALSRQINGLEQEVREKQSKIDGLEIGKKQEVAILESDLIDSEAEKSASSPPIADSTSLAVKEQLELAKADLEVERQLHGKQITELRSEVSIKETEITTLKGSIQEKEKTIAKIQDELTLQKVKVALVQPELCAAVLQTKLKVKEKEEVPVKIKPETVWPPLLSSSGEPKASFSGSFSEARKRALEVLKGKVRTNLNLLRGLLRTRDDLYRKYNSQKRRVEFKLSRAISSQNHDIASLARELEKVESVYMISSLTRQIREIESKVQSDIGLLQRMERL